MNRIQSDMKAIQTGKQKKCAMFDVQYDNHDVNNDHRF